jgi:hypothetical protein
MVLLPFAAGAQGGSLEAAIKATYLVKFTSFAVWPERVFVTASSPLVICVAGPDPFGSALDQAARGQLVGQHPIEIRRIAASAQVAGCHILFASEGVASEAPAYAAVLTVTDLPAGSARRGIINFVVQDNHVRFEIDERAAVAQGLEISSQLLALAVSVRSRQ